MSFKNFDFEGALNRISAVVSQVGAEIQTGIQRFTTSFDDNLDQASCKRATSSSLLRRSRARRSSYSNDADSSLSSMGNSTGICDKRDRKTYSPSNVNGNTSGSKISKKSNLGCEAAAENTHQCDHCHVAFSLTNRKKTCVKCQVAFCGLCLTGTLDGQCPSSSTAQISCRLCFRCRLLQTDPPDRNELSKLAVKDLQRYLNSADISTKTCCEKKDLIDLIIHQRGSNNTVFNEPSNEAIGEASGGEIFDHKFVSPNQVNLEGEIEIETNNDEGISSAIPLPMGASCTVSPPVATLSTMSSSINDLTEVQEVVCDKEDGDSSQLESEFQDTLQPCLHETSSSTDLVGNSSSPSRFSGQDMVSLSEISNIEVIQELSVKQAKNILALNRVNYTGVREKDELFKIVERLWKQDQRNKIELRDLEEDDSLCKICMDAVVDCVMLECGHMCTCTNCGKMMTECPICRQYVIRVVRAFKA